MLCGEIPISLYINALASYLEEDEKTIEGAKKYIGADEETFKELIKDKEFKRLIDLI